MANVIKIKNSGVVTTAPTSLEFGELAINYADGLLFFKDSSGAIISFNLKQSSTVNTADLAVSLAMEIA
jgi:hypothetical protein